MARITEDYVSFEVAKLLKEKGFHKKVNHVYHYYNTAPFYHRHIRDFNGEDYKNLRHEHYSAPTLQTAMKWLREVHNIMVSPYALSLGYYFEIFDLTDRDITGCKPLHKLGLPSKEDVLSTYEEAVEAAIKYCLENLI